MRSELVKTIMLAGFAVTLAGFTAQAAAPAKPQGYATAQEFTDIGGTSVENDLRGNSKFPNSPDIVAYTPRFEWPTGPNDATPPAGDVKNNYGVRILGYLYPPANGNYIFAIAADDNAEMWLSSNAEPATKTLIAVEPQWNPVRAFSLIDRRTEGSLENVSAPIALKANTPYYFEALMKEGGGGDNLAVAWSATSTPPQNNDLPILGKYLATFDKAFETPEVLSRSSGIFGFTFGVVEGDSATAAKVDKASIVLTLDGNVVANTLTQDGASLNVAYVSATPLASKSKHKARLDFKDTKNNPISSEFNFTVATFATLDQSLAITDADTTKPGFTANVSVVTGPIAGYSDVNNNQRTEDQLNGLVKDADGNILANLVSGNPFTIEGVVNFNQDDPGNAGNFQPDLPIPGVTADTGNDNIAAEFLTYIELPKGSVTMGVNSDDGFRVTAGNVRDALGAVFCGQFNGGRGAADTTFQIVVVDAGVYCFRMTWEEGGGGANVEWFVKDADGKNVLINGPGGPKAYRARKGAAANASVVKSVTPAANAAEVSNGTNIGAVITDGGTALDNATVKMKVNGTDVTPKFAKAGKDTTITYDPATDFSANSSITVDLSYNNGAGVVSGSWSFTTSFITVDTLFIETEDADYEGGKFATGKIGMDGPYPGGAYAALGTDADNGIDWFAPGGNAGQPYRPDTGLAAGKPNGSAGLSRGYFNVEVNHSLGWNDAGDWQNYTRVFPTPAKKYNVWFHASSGGGPIEIRVDQITAGVGKPDDQQVKVKLFDFKPGRATAGWDSLEVFKVLDPDGNPVEVELGGKVTLRSTSTGGNNDTDWIAFAAAPTGGGGVNPEIKIVKSATGLSLEFKGNLEVADTANGPYNAVAGATSPRPVTADTTQKYWRTKK